METQVIVTASKKEIEDLFNDVNLPYLIKYYEVNKDNPNDITVVIRHAENVRVRKKKFDNIKAMDKAFRKEGKDLSMLLDSISIIGQNITYPMYGNKHATAYGTLVIDGKIGKKVCRIQEDNEYNNYSNYITYNRKRYYVKNIGRYMAANFVIDEHKTKDYYYSKGYQEVII